MRSLIFFDIDGTIIDSDNNIPASAVTAIRQARTKGNICIINTGRPFSHIEHSVIDIGFDGYICSCGQHVILDGNDLLYETISPDICNEMITLARRCHIDIFLESEHGFGFMLNHNCSSPDSLQHNKDRFLERGYPPLEDASAAGYTFDKLCVWVYPDSDREAFFSFANEKFTCIDRGGGMFELILRGYSKETGLQLVIDHLNMPIENCHAIGDSTNDLPMLRCVPHAIVMGDAPEIVKCEAEYVTGKLADDGLYHALAHYKLL